MKPSTLLVVTLGSLALFSGWKTREALLAPPLAVGNAARPSAVVRTPGAPIPDPAPPPDSAAAVAAVAARPLFRPDRMPFREDAAVAGRNYDAELSRLSMIGLLTFGGELKGLVVAKGSPGAERWEVGKGDSLPGFKVKEVREEGLSVTADGKTFLIPLYAGAPDSGGPLRTEVPKAGGSQGTAAGSRPAAPAVKTPPGATMTADSPSTPATQPPKVLPAPAAQPMMVLPTPPAQPVPRFPPWQGAR